jgi:hypothetical protein
MQTEQWVADRAQLQHLLHKHASMDPKRVSRLGGSIARLGQKMGQTPP